MLIPSVLTFIPVNLTVSKRVVKPTFKAPVLILTMVPNRTMRIVCSIINFIFFHFYYLATRADTCTTVAKNHGITLDQFYDMNPSINRGACDNLLTGGIYCVKQVQKKIAKNIASLNTSPTSLPRKTKVSKAHTHKKKKYSKKRKSSTKKRKSSTKSKKTTKTTSTKKKTTTKKTTTKKATTKKATTKKTTTTTTKRGTSTTTTTKPKTTTQRATTTKKEEDPKPTGSSDKRKLLQKGSDFTYYWIAHPDDYSHKGKDITVKTCDGDSIGTVSEEYADALVMEGTGIVGNKVINLGGCSCSSYRCFMEVDKKEDPYGLTGKYLTYLYCINFD